MRSRCQKKTHISYERYGGRGIRVCDRWNDFPAFLEDMGHPPASHTLDRIDNNGDYCKENCRWATVYQQARNTRTNNVFMAYGETKTLVEWSEDSRCAVSYGTLKWRINHGLEPEFAMTRPAKTTNVKLPRVAAATTLAK